TSESEAVHFCGCHVLYASSPRGTQLAVLAGCLDSMSAKQQLLLLACHHMRITTTEAPQCRRAPQRLRIMLRL
ncbi:hypothetical protein E2562_010121, partial [Oryza meyeriana var. granulata]